MQSAVQSSLNTHLKDLNSDISADIVKSVDFIHSLLMRAGIPTKAYTSSGVNTLLGLTAERQREVQSNLRQLREIILAVTAGGDIETIDEVALVEKALGYFSFKLKNHTWEATAREEVIEIYNHRGVQLYRSLNFFKTCGYSILDLCVNEWFVLWERPRKVLAQLNEIVAEVMEGKHPNGIRMDVLPHIIRETHNDGTTQPFSPRSLMVQFKYMYPAYSAGGEISGFVVTSTCEVLSVGAEAMKLDFI
jgi:hypothetical protein